MNTPSITEIVKTRFFKKVGFDKRGCHPWNGARYRTGYGQIRINKKLYQSHRVAYLIEYGFLPPLLRHTCDNPSCVNPRHLVPGTNADNSRDMIERDRAANQEGANNGNVKLTDDDVRDIRESTDALKELALRYKVHLSTIGYIRQRKLWKHII